MEQVTIILAVAVVKDTVLLGLLVMAVKVVAEEAVTIIQIALCGVKEIQMEEITE
jgi:hypothetical protein